MNLRISSLIALVLITSIACSTDDSESPEENETPVSNLVLVNTVSDTSPFFEDNITFTLKVSNAGPDAATGVVVKDQIPTGYTYISDDGNASSIYNENTGEWILPTIPSGTNKTLNITIKVNLTGDYTNIAEIIASDNLDSNSTPNNNIASEDDQDSVTTSPIENGPVSNLVLVNTVSDTSPYFEDNITFTLNVSNAGPDAATGVVVKNQIPTGYTYVSDDGDATSIYNENTGEWVLPTILNGTNKILNITTKVNLTGNYTNVAEIITSDNLDFNSTPNNNIASEDDQDSVATLPVVDIASVQVTTFAVLQARDALTVDSSGNLFAANFGTHIVYKIDANATISTFATNQLGAAGMAFDSQGSMFLARYNTSEIAKISADGSMIEVFASGVLAPIAVEFDSQGNLFVNNNFTTSTITKITPAGVKSLISAEVHNSSSLTIDDDDNIYVSDYDSGIIRKIDAITNNVTIFSTLPIAGGVGYITYSDGLFYVTADSAIFMINSEGYSNRIAGEIGSPGVNDGNGDVARFNGSIGIAASQDGKTLYVADGGLGAIRVINDFRD